MFGFLKRRKIELQARNLIGVELHRQISEAFRGDEESTAKRLPSFFTAGYLYGFVRIGFFTITGVGGEPAAARHLKHICDGVLPGTLYEIFQRMLAALEVARGIEKRDVKRSATLPSPVEADRMFEAGAEYGLRDATDCFAPFSNSRSNGLRDFLTGKIEAVPLSK